MSNLNSFSYDPSRNYFIYLKINVRIRHTYIIYVFINLSKIESFQRFNINVRMFARGHYVFVQTNNSYYVLFFPPL